jgi:ferredoxin
MRDPECVRCSACVQQCPTGVLSFGRFGARDKKKIVLDSLPASPVLMREGREARHQVAERQLETLQKQRQDND